MGMGQRDLAQGSPRRFQPSCAIIPELFNGGGHVGRAVFPGNADGQPLDAAPDGSGKIGTARSALVESLGSKTRHRAQQDGGIFDGFGNRPGLIERGGKGNDAPARAAVHKLA